MKLGDLEVMINGAAHELLEKLERGENGLDEFLEEMLKIVSGAQVDLFEKSIIKFHDNFTEDQVSDIRGKLIRAWIEWNEKMTGRNPENYKKKDTDYA
jgi:hypothetical protein